MSIEGFLGILVGLYFLLWVGACMSREEAEDA